MTTTTQHPSPYGIQQPYGHSEYPEGSESYPSPPAGHVAYPTEAAYLSSTRYSCNSSQNGRQAPYPTAIPPPPATVPLKVSLAKETSLLPVPPRRRKCIERDEGICRLFSLFCNI